MKLIYCTHCKSVINLNKRRKICPCKRSSGKMLDDLICEISGFAIVLQFGSTRFKEAIENQAEKGLGRNFDAYVLPRNTPSVKKKEDGKLKKAW